MLRVIPALMDVLAEARKDAAKSRADVASACGVGEKTVERWEAGENYPLREGGDDLARVVAAYAEMTHTPSATLWRRAVDRAAGATEAGEVQEPEPKEHSPRRTARVGQSRGPVRGGGRAASS